MEYGTLLESNWFWPLIFIVSGLISGFIFKRLVLPRLKKLASQTKWEVDNIALDAAAKYWTLWFAVAGFYGAAIVAPLSEPVDVAFKTILFVIAAFSVTLVLARIATDVVTNYARKQEGVFQATSMFKLMINAVALIIGILIILKALRVDITPLLGGVRHRQHSYSFGHTGTTGQFLLRASYHRLFPDPYRRLYQAGFRR